MNYKKHIAVLSLLLVLAITFSIPAAVGVETFYGEAEIEVSNNGTVWRVNFEEDGIDPDDVDYAEAFVVTTENTEGFYLEASTVVVKKNEVQVVIPISLQDELREGLDEDNEILETGLDLYLLNGDLWIYSGPAYTSSFRPH